MYSNDEHTNFSFKELKNRLFRRRTKRLLSDTEKEFQRYLDCSSVLLVILLVMGAIFASVSSISTELCQVLLAVFMIVYGLMHGVFFLRRRKFSFYKFSIFFGIINLVLGVAFLFISFSHILIVLGIYFLFVVLERLLEGFYLFQIKDDSKIVFLVSSLLLAFLAILLMINPFQELLYHEIIGIFVILFSVLNLSNLSILVKRINHFVAAFD